MDLDFRDVVRAFAALANMGVRADSERADWRFCVVGPFANGLGHQRQRWHHEQNALALACDGFGDLQRSESLARAAGHDHLAAVGRREALADVCQRVLLMVQQGLLGAEDDFAPRFEDRPVDPAFTQICQADANDGDRLVPDHFLRVDAPFLFCRVENDAPSKGLLARCRDETVDIGFLNARVSSIELGLNCREAILVA